MEQSIQVDESPVDRHGDCLGSVGRSEFGEDILEMNLDSLGGAPDRAGHLLVPQPSCHQLQDLELALAQFTALRVLGQPGGHGGWNDPLASRHGSDGADHLGEQHVLQQVSPSAGLQGPPDIRVAFVSREGKNSGGRKLSGDAPNGLDTIDHRHAEVHEDHVWVMFSIEGKGAIPILGLGHQQQVRLLIDNSGKPGADNRVIVGHKDTQPLLLRSGKFVHATPESRGTTTLKKDPQKAGSNSPIGGFGALGWVNKLIQAL